MTTGDSGGEAYTAIAWGVGLSHERSDIVGAESFYSLEGNMCGTVMRGAVALPGSKATSRAKGSYRNAKFGPWQLLHCLVVSVFRPLWPNFPKQSNREFWARKQGSYYPEQGSHCPPSGPLPRAKHKRLRGRSRKKKLRAFPSDDRQIVIVAESQPQPVPCHTNDRDRAHPLQLMSRCVAR